VNGWVVHRDKQVFGEHVEEFKPERWLKDVEQAKRMERDMFFSSAAEVICVLDGIWRCWSRCIRIGH
jgi:hypothetical protein